MMDFPQEVPHKLTTEEMANVNKAICDMGPTEEITFNYFTKPDETEIQSEVATLTSLIKQSFYPIPIGASAPVIKIYQRSLKLEYRAIRTTLALIKYYICPTLQKDMDKFFIKYVVSVLINTLCFLFFYLKYFPVLIKTGVLPYF